MMGKDGECALPVGSCSQVTEKTVWLQIQKRQRATQRRLSPMRSTYLGKWSETFKRIGGFENCEIYSLAGAQQSRKT